MITLSFDVAKDAAQNKLIQKLFGAAIARGVVSFTHEVLLQYPKALSLKDAVGYIDLGKQLYKFGMRSELVKFYDVFHGSAIRSVKNYGGRDVSIRPIDLLGGGPNRKTVHSTLRDFLSKVDSLAATVTEQRFGKTEAERRKGDRARAAQFKFVGKLMTRHADKMTPEMATLAKSFLADITSSTKGLSAIVHPELFQSSITYAAKELAEKYLTVENVQIVQKQLEALPKGQDVAKLIDDNLITTSSMRLARKTREYAALAAKVIEPYTGPTSTWSVAKKRPSATKTLG